MKLQQLRAIHEVLRHGLNVSLAAEALFTSQPGVSKQIQMLEEELGVEIFVRQGRRLVAVTEPGERVLEIAARMLQDAANIKAMSRDYATESRGQLTIATTHTQARYALPAIIPGFLQDWPEVRLSLHQGNPTQVCEQVVAGEADLAIATEAIETFPELAMLPCYQWNRVVIAPKGHPVARELPLTLDSIAAFPLITYDFAFTGRSQINRAFTRRGLAPDVVLTALDADIIKTYVRMGLGVGIVARMACDPSADADLEVLDASHLFESATTRIGIRRGTYLRGYAYDFIERFAPHLTRRVVDATLQGSGATDPGL